MAMPTCHRQSSHRCCATSARWCDVRSCGPGLLGLSLLSSALTRAVNAAIRCDGAALLMAFVGRAGWRPLGVRVDGVMLRGWAFEVLWVSRARVFAAFGVHSRGQRVDPLRDAAELGSDLLDPRHALAAIRGQYEIQEDVCRRQTVPIELDARGPGGVHLPAIDDGDWPGHRDARRRGRRVRRRRPSFAKLRRPGSPRRRGHCCRNTASARRSTLSVDAGPRNPGQGGQCVDD